MNESRRKGYGMAVEHVGRLRRGLAIVAVAAAIVVPGALVFAPSASAAAPAAASNPLGPTIAQLEHR